MKDQNLVIYARDINGANIWHGERWGSDDWRWTGPRYSGMLRGNTEHAISALADEVGEGRVWLVADARADMPLRVDRAGNAWVDGVYMPAAQWIPALLGWATSRYIQGID